MSIFAYDAASMAAVEEWLSPDRLSTYRAATANDLEAAIKLHVHNTALSAAFFAPVQIVEVALRNAFHREFEAHFGANWPAERAFLDLSPDIEATINDARASLTRMRKPVDVPHIVAELHFGFWTTLTGGGFEHTLWTPALSKAFKGYAGATGKGPKRSTISGQLNHIRGFRNRIVHHEPIFHRALDADYSTLLQMAGWLAQGLDSWIGYHSRISFLLPRRELY